MGSNPVEVQNFFHVNLQLLKLLITTVNIYLHLNLYFRSSRQFPYKSNILQTFKIWNYGVNLTNKDIQQNAKKYSSHTVFEQSFLRILYHVLPTGICSGQLISCIRRLAERRVPPLATCWGGYEDSYIGSRPIFCVHLNTWMKWNTEWRWWLLKLLITTATIISSFEKLFFRSSDHLHSMFDENIFGAFLHFFPSVLVRKSAYLSLLWVNSFIISPRLIMPKKQRNAMLLPEKRLPLYIEAT